MIFHPLHCFARKVNTCYKTQGEAGPAPSCPLGGQGGEGPPCQVLCTHHQALAHPHFTDGETRFREVKPHTQGHTAGCMVEPDSHRGWPQATACGFFPGRYRPGPEHGLHLFLFTAVFLRVAQKPTRFSIPGSMCLLTCRFLGCTKTHPPVISEEGPWNLYF